MPTGIKTRNWLLLWVELIPSRRSKNAGNERSKTSVIVDVRGKELGRIVGSADWASAEAAQLIDVL